MLITQQYASETIAYEVQVTGDTIISAAWSVAPAGPVIGSISTTSTTSTALVSGMTAGVLYTLLCVATCASGQVVEERALVRCAG